MARIVAESGVRTGLATIFMQHTSASLVIYENADPSAREDLHRYFEKLVPEDDPDWVHTLEGPDDTTSHLRMALTAHERDGAGARGAAWPWAPGRGSLSSSIAAPRTRDAWS
ncbi:MAG: secondary thiamine-phosphate synthase enzyme YjbQ [Chthoniobacter sp.]